MGLADSDFDGDFVEDPPSEDELSDDELSEPELSEPELSEALDFEPEAPFDDLLFSEPDEEFAEASARLSLR